MNILRAARWMKWRWVAVAVVIAAALDFNHFRHTAATLENADTAGADGIVVLTGGSGLRIAAGLAMLEAGDGERMLISGVNRAISADEITSRIGGDARLYDCCVDVGYEATDTVTNAEEVGAWAARHGFERLVLVTSSYHMPRALHLMETTASTRQIIFVPAPVTTRIDPARAFGDWASFRGVVTEWLKWRVTRVITAFRRGR